MQFMDTEIQTVHQSTCSNVQIGGKVVMCWLHLIILFEVTQAPSASNLCCDYTMLSFDPVPLGLMEREVLI